MSAMQPTSLGDRLRPFALVVVRAFFVTWLAVAAGGIALAVASGTWMPNVGSFARVLLQVLFAVQFITVGFFIATRSALAMALTRGVRQMHLGRVTLKMLMGKIGTADDKNRDGETDLIDGPGERALASREISATIASERLQRIMGLLNLSGRAQGSGFFGWLQSSLVGAVGTVMLSRFRSGARQAEKIDLATVERELEDQIDGLLLTRLRFTFLTWSVIVVAVLIAEVVAIAFIANWLAS
jgi:hypothetical protein